MNLQTDYQKAIRYASLKHAEINQTIPGTIIPYAVHISNVAMEIIIAGQHTMSFDLNFAVQVALLHDILEDTDVSFEELSNEFGNEIAIAVLALTKNNLLPKDEQMPDCIKKIKQCKKEVWTVKLADRITNLQPPPAHWDAIKRKYYLEQAKYILNELKSGNKYLRNRLIEKINQYQDYIYLYQVK